MNEIFTCWWPLLSRDVWFLPLPHKWVAAPEEAMRRVGNTISQNCWTCGRKSLKIWDRFVPRDVWTKSLTEIYTPDWLRFREDGRSKRSWVFLRKTEWFPVKEAMIITMQEYLKDHNWCGCTQTTTDLLSHYYVIFFKKKTMKGNISEKKCAKSIMGNVFLNKTLQSMEKCVFNYISSECANLHMHVSLVFSKEPQFRKTWKVVAKALKECLFIGRVFFLIP